VLKDSTGYGSAQSWVLIAIAVACLLLIVLLVLSIVRQGHGHTRTLIHENAAATPGTPTGGAVIIDGRVAEQAIQSTLDGHPGLVSSNVTTWKVRGTSVLSITTNVRRGVSPLEIRRFVDSIIADWDAALGRELPVVIQINAGLVTRIAKSSRFARQSVIEP
jgi:hypothetical protein